MCQMPPPQNSTIAKRAGAAAFYAASSLLIVLSNKILLTAFKFPSFISLALFQSIASIAILRTLRFFKMISFADMDRTTWNKLFPLPFIFAANVVAGLGGTKSVTLPMFTALRRFSIFFIMSFEAIILGTKHSSTLKIALAMMIGGACIAAFSDLSFDLWGYTLIFINNLLTALNGVVIKSKLNLKESFNSFGMMYYNSLFSFPFLAMFLYFSPTEMENLRNFDWSQPYAMVFFSISVLMGAVLNYSIFLCTQINSALTTGVVGALKNVLTAYLGMLGIFGDYTFQLLNFLGLNVSIIGSLVYAREVYLRSRRNKTSQEITSAEAEDGDEK